MLPVSRTGQRQTGVRVSKQELFAEASFGFRHQAQSDLEKASEVSPLHLRDVAYLKVHEDGGLGGGIGHAHPRARSEVLEDLLFGVRNEHAQPARRHVKKKTAVHGAGKRELQKGVGGIRLCVSPVLLTPVFWSRFYGSFPPRVLPIIS